MNKNTGKIVVIEGLDGSGKSTQWEMLKKSFADAVFVTFPDYESDSGRIIKRYLSGEFDGETAYAASSFYAVDRYISYKNRIEGVTSPIISARYTSSNAIYQMSKLPESQWEEYLRWSEDFEHEKLTIPRADLTVFLDVPIDVSQELLNKRYAGGNGGKDIHEGDVAYLMTCRKAALYAAVRGGWTILDCMKSGALRTPDDINAELTEILRNCLSL